MFEIPPVERALSIPCPNCGGSIIYDVEKLSDTMVCLKCKTETVVSEELKAQARFFKEISQSSADHINNLY